MNRKITPILRTFMWLRTRAEMAQVQCCCQPRLNGAGIVTCIQLFFGRLRKAVRCTCDMDSACAMTCWNCWSRNLTKPTPSSRLESFVVRLPFVHLFQIKLGNAELAFQLAELFQINRADDIDEDQFFRLGRQDGQA